MGGTKGLLNPFLSSMACNRSCDRALCSGTLVAHTRQEVRAKELLVGFLTPVGMLVGRVKVVGPVALNAQIH